MEKLSLLTHELQLETKLNQSLTESRRSDFALMLALCSKDVREQSQFFLPETDNSSADTTEEGLKDTLQVHSLVKIAVTDPSDLSAYNQSAELTPGQEHIRLANCIEPKALALCDNPMQLAEEVLHNTGVHTQARIKHKLSGDETLNQHVSLNVSKWIDAVEASRLYS